MSTRSKTREQDDPLVVTLTEEKEDRGNNQQEHEMTIETETRDVAELTETLHKISFGEPKDVSTKELKTITSARQLKDELPAICNEVFRVLGPYNLEATYQRALALELRDRGVKVLSEVEIPILYKGQRIATRRVDLHLQLDKPVLLELKAVVTGLKPEHMKQLKFYMTHYQVHEGYLINFPHLTGFPDQSEVQFVEQVLQPENGVGLSDRVTRSTTPRKDATPKIIHVQGKAAANETIKESITTKTTNVKAVFVGGYNSFGN